MSTPFAGGEEALLALALGAEEARLGLGLRLHHRVERGGELVGREDVDEVDGVEAHPVALADLRARELLEARVQAPALAADQRERAALQGELALTDRHGVLGVVALLAGVRGLVDLVVRAQLGGPEVGDLVAQEAREEPRDVLERGAQAEEELGERGLDGHVAQDRVEAQDGAVLGHRGAPALLPREVEVLLLHVDDDRVLPGPLEVQPRTAANGACPSPPSRSAAPNVVSTATWPSSTRK